MKRLFVFCLALMGLVSMSWAATYEDRLLDELIGNRQAEYNDYNDNSPFSILYTGAGSAAALTINGSTLTLAITGSGQGAVAAIFLNTADYNTFGEVYNFIRSTGYYTITMKDCRRAENSMYLGDVNAQSVLTSYDVLLDTGSTAGGDYLAGAGFGCSIALNDPTASTSASAGNVKSTKKVRLFKAIGNGDVASAGVIRIYKEDSALGWAETKVWDEAIANETDKTLTFSSNDPYGGFDFNEGDRVIVTIASDEVQDIGADMQVHWMEW